MEEYCEHSFIYFLGATINILLCVCYHISIHLSISLSILNPVLNYIFFISFTTNFPLYALFSQEPSHPFFKNKQPLIIPAPCPLLFSVHIPPPWGKKGATFSTFSSSSFSHYSQAAASPLRCSCSASGLHNCSLSSLALS